jgi:hypothetical protein
VTPAVHSAVAELTALALAARPDWDEQAVRGAILAAHTVGWDWTRTLVEMAKLIADPDAEPRHLRDEVRDPLKRRTTSRTPEEVRQRVAELRAQLPDRSGGDTHERSA